MDLVVPDEGNEGLPRSFECEANNPVLRRKTTLPAFIGAHEIFSKEMWRAALTELVATASFGFTINSATVSSLDSHDPEPKLVVPFAVFFVIFLFMLSTVPLSGGHMNPIFTFMAALKRHVTIVRALIYVLAQCVGSIIGFLVMKSVMSHRAAHTYALGGCMITGGRAGAGVSVTTALLVEFSCTFVVLCVGVTVAFDKKRCRELGLPMVCVVVAGAIATAVFVSSTITGQAGYGGVGLNPAKCLGPAVVQGGPLWDGHWVFWVGPFLACIVYYGYSLNMPKVWGLDLELEK